MCLEEDEENQKPIAIFQSYDKTQTGTLKVYVNNDEKRDKSINLTDYWKMSIHYLFTLRTLK